MKILVLTSSYLAPTYNDKIISQVNYINSFKNMHAELCNDLPLYKIEEKIIENKYDCVFPAVVFEKKERNNDFCFNTSIYNVLLYHKQDYIGSDVFTQMLLNDKALTSLRSGIGLPSVIVTKALWNNSRNIACNYLNNIEYPVIIKPNTLSASMGITKDSIVYNKEAAIRLIDKQFKEFPVLTEVLLEKYLENAKEYTVSVTGNGDDIIVCPTMLESKTNDFEIYSYDDKRTPSNNRSISYKIVSNESHNEKLINTTIEIFKKFNLRDYCRFDYLVDRNGNIYLIDANTIPALGLNYLYPYYYNGNLKIEQILSVILLAFAKRKGIELPKEFIDSIPNALVKGLGL